ncbi:MAG: ABC transporter ATP-binding protein [Thermomicrobiales bacterium]|nr:ABC transporter ATP-binding protein [Thermomicrobiales bacterium]MCO5220191.1 ABC transporter ATP-binding protein [Thermomicrobiales bacterium]
MTLLYLSKLNVFYGANHAVRDLDLQIEEGEIVGLIGANGAGKSTTMMSIMGAVKPRSGAVVFDGRNITGMAPEDVLKLGIAPVMEGRRIFQSLTVGENLRMGAATVADKDQVAKDIERWCILFPILKERYDRPAGNLSGGQQQMVAVARALMSRPRVLLMDEPSLGLAPLIVADIFKLIAELRSLGMTVLLVEQNVRMTLNIADRAYLLNLGRVEFSGTPDQIRAEADIERTYLGGGQTSAPAASPATAS